MSSLLFTNSRHEEEDKFEERFKESLDNSFLIFTGQRTYIEIILDKTKSHFFFFDPDMVPTKDDVMDLLYIYEEYEEYEKCGELYNLLREI